MTCDYCGKSDCRACKRKIHQDLRVILDALERGLCDPDVKDEVGINTHLRVAWGVRDAINEYFATGTCELLE